ncbi:rna polymerase rpb1 c-terminal repeat domain-containing protein [Venturia nashicola]|uniref:Rna polymerase rpb1 c-terminal repeat domain-containing protein n=1 Tax=Venturia nashicola TaxID=86259 RepID=A0A4Z1P9A0_9PEZI|nr:rna polymerase rpb1 c-terminal repeat domain-containing protein [Venturia nashicola]
MAKKNNNKKAAPSTRAAETATNTTELTPALSPSQLKPFTEETSLAFSLPPSPVAKIAPSFHLSPTLSTTDSNNPLSSDFNPFLIPPPFYHYDDPQESAAVEDDWEIPEPQPLKRKSKKARKKQPILQIPEDPTDYENSDAPLSDCPPDTIQSETDCHSDTEREEVHVKEEPPSKVETTEPEPSAKAATAKLEPASITEPGLQPKPNDSASEKVSVPNQEKQLDPETAVPVAVPKAEEQLAKPQTSKSEGAAETNEVSAGNEIATRDPEQLSSTITTEDLKSNQAHPAQSGYWPSGYYGQHHPHPSRNMAYQPPFPYGMSPPINGPSYHPPYSNYPGYPAYGNGSSMQRHDSFGSARSIAGDHGPIPSDNASIVEDDPADLLNRVSSILPDIHMLIDRHKNTHGELSLREQLIRKEKAESAEAARNKDEYINRLIKQLHEAEQNNVADASKFRLHIGNLEDKRKEMEENLLDAELSRKAVQAMNKQLSEEKESLIEDKLATAKLAAEEKDRVAKELEECKIKAEQLLEAEKQKTAEEKVRLLRDLEDLKAAALDAQKLQLDKEHDKALKEQQESFDAQRLKMVEDFAKEKDELRTSLQAQRKEIESNFETMRKDLEGKLNSTQANLEQVIKTEREGREQWGAERETITRGWEQERDSREREVEDQRQGLIKSHEEEIAVLVRKHRDDINEQTMGFVSLQEGINKKMTAENEGLREQLESLKKAWDQDKEKFEGIVRELSGVAEALDSEKGRLQKLVEGYGEITDVKSKGDAYYIDAFASLSNQIVELATTQFVSLPSNPDPDALARIPATLPSILDNSTASCDLRASFIAHTISSILTVRVFTPFLFSLGLISDQADALLTNLGHQLSSKSTRKEAIWRQHTLTAAYTTTDAKARINSAAGGVIEEIITSIMPFTEADAEEAVRAAVRPIVKLAVEVWRYARLEREAIGASMLEPAAEKNLEEDLWVPQSFESSSYPVHVVKPVSRHGSKQLLLKIFPVIRREPIHQCFRQSETDMEDDGCLYSPGIALYKNSPPVLARLAELRRRSGASSPTESLTFIGELKEAVAPRLQPSSDHLPLHSAPAPYPPPLTTPCPSPTLAPRTGPPTPLFRAVGEIDGQDNHSERSISPALRRTGTPSLGTLHHNASILSWQTWEGPNPSLQKEKERENVKETELGTSKYEGKNGFSPALARVRKESAR